MTASDGSEKRLGAPSATGAGGGERSRTVDGAATKASAGSDPETINPKWDEAETLLRTRFMLDYDEYEEGYGRRRFLYLSTMAATVAGFGFFIWPFVHSMNPASDVEAAATTEVDLSAIEPGESVTVVWRGKPVFVRHRTPDEIQAAQQGDSAPMPDPQPDGARVQKAEWLVAIGICNHLGCVPRGQRPTDPKGEYGGWFCPCHGSHFDTSGRIRKGPAPNNLTIPEYTFLDDNRLRIG